jgi:hypothetical protein
MPLTYTPQSGDILSFTIDFDRFDCEDFFGGHGRWQYTCTIRYDGVDIDAGPIRSGTTTQDNPEGLGSMLGSFLSFFSAYVEADEDSENRDLFPAACRPLADMLDSGQVFLWADEIRRSV